MTNRHKKHTERQQPGGSGRVDIGLGRYTRPAIRRIIGRARAGGAKSKVNGGRALGKKSRERESASAGNTQERDTTRPQWGPGGAPPPTQMGNNFTKDEATKKRKDQSTTSGGNKRQKRDKAGEG